MLKPFSERQKATIANNVAKACIDINKLTKSSYKYLYLCSGFIAHYNFEGFKSYYSKHSLKKDIEQNARANMWKNFSPSDRDYAYYMSKADIYRQILGNLVARDELDAMQFMRDHFVVVTIGE